MTVLSASIGFLGFDVFGTIVDWRSGVARAAEPFLRKHGIAIDPLAFADAWRSLYQPAMQRVRSGERPWVRLEILHRENLETVLARHGTDPAAIAEAELADLNRAWDRLDPWPDAVEGLAVLKKRFVLGALSNGSIAGMVQLARFGGLPWDVITGSEIAQSYKPTPQTYLKSLEAAGFRPGQAAMVAAHNGDLAAARALGLRTIFVRRPLEHGPGQTTDLAAEGDWDIVADSLIEVARALGPAPHTAGSASR
jgi:2-haloacid dehalogenase